ncbi:hypothetical protein C483_15512 [Natrialba hulunbeirensis JCM 10989]|uniref:DUF7322 domain-containing protein n=1 Tax=Natrialba hulunbeirensis JCM 10989 TaxID=1227493 RepID=L9ZRP1_9EURY|nr:hypothetical protein [Natrialba hulunbeirensis]ELY88756.1 hypothetical protein C483_15512 [Natrialba hulunbeirensis JCM 10989]
MTTDRTSTDDADDDRESVGASATDTDHGPSHGSVSPSDSDSTTQSESTTTTTTDDETAPGEWNPEKSYRDSSTDSLTIPRVETEDAGSTFMEDFRSEHESESGAGSVSVPEVSTEESDVPTELLKAFWGIVIVLNAAILAVALGLMFMFFEGVSQTAGALVVGGIVLFGFAYYRYWSFQNRTDGFSVPDSGEMDGSDDGVADDRAEDDRTKDNGADADGDKSIDTADTAERDDDISARTDEKPSTEAEHSGSDDDTDIDRQY